jgi:undecaprenyl-diphosphatase
MTQLDDQLFRMINGFAASLSLLNPVMRFLAQDGEYVFFLGVVAYWLIRTTSNRRMIVEALTAACIGLALSGLIGHIFYRDRPFVAHDVFQLIPHAANASFPSDHATGAFVIATAIWLFRKREGTIWLLLAACVALSRVWTGVHYPMDVAAGALLGVLTAAGVHRMFSTLRFARTGMDWAIGLYERTESTVWPRKPIEVKEIKGRKGIDRGGTNTHFDC